MVVQITISTKFRYRATTEVHLASSTNRFGVDLFHVGGGHVPDRFVKSTDVVCLGFGKLAEPIFQDIINKPDRGKFVVWHNRTALDLDISGGMVEMYCDATQA